MSNSNKITHNQAVLNRIKIRKKANDIISKYHAGQKRKDGEDFVNHPIRVSKIISDSLKHSESLDNCFIAGLLHDTIEDTEYSKKQLLADFGEDIYKIVMECTEDKSKSWIERKEHTIEKLDEISLEGLVVTLADKIDNLNSLARTIDQEKISLVELFDQKFNASIKNQKWYYSEIYLKALKIVFDNDNEKNRDKLLKSNLDRNDFNNLFNEYKRAINKVFDLFSGSKYLDNIEQINNDNYIPILQNRSIENDTNIFQFQYAKTNIDGKNYYWVYEIWSWDGIGGNSAVFISKQFQNLTNDKKKSIILKCLNFNDDEIPKKGNYTFKDTGEFIFYNYDFSAYDD